MGYELTLGRDYSEATAKRIDEEVEHLLEDRHSAARRLLIAGREALNRLAKALLNQETVDRDTLEQILGPRPAIVVDRVENENSLQDVVEV